MGNYRRIIKEAIGVHEDVKTLSEFIYKNLKGDRKTEIFTADELPTLKDLKINKIIINNKGISSIEGEEAQFNSGKSKNTENGLIIYLNFFGSIEKNSVYHELTHALQFQKIGKGGLNKKLKATKQSRHSSDLSPTSSKEEKDIIDTFTYYVYQSQEHEIAAKVTETYAIINEELKGFDLNHPEIRKKYINRVLPLIIESSYGWKAADRMINYDIFKEFKEVNPNTTMRFFSLMKDMEKYVKMEEKRWPRVKEIFKTIFRIVSLHKYPNKLKIISEDEVVKMMKYYNNFINKQGLKLKKKLSKLYAHFV